MQKLSKEVIERRFNNRIIFGSETKTSGLIIDIEYKGDKNIITNCPISISKISEREDSDINIKSTINGRKIYDWRGSCKFDHNSKGSNDKMHVSFSEFRQILVNQNETKKSYRITTAKEINTETQNGEILKKELETSDIVKIDKSIKHLYLIIIYAVSSSVPIVKLYDADSIDLNKNGKRYICSVSSDDKVLYNSLDSRLDIRETTVKSTRGITQLNLEELNEIINRNKIYEEIEYDKDGEVVFYYNKINGITLRRTDLPKQLLDDGYVSGYIEDIFIDDLLVEQQFYQFGEDRHSIYTDHISKFEYIKNGDKTDTIFTNLMTGEISSSNPDINIIPELELPDKMENEILEAYTWKDGFKIVKSKTENKIRYFKNGILIKEEYLNDANFVDRVNIFGKNNSDRAIIEHSFFYDTESVQILSAIFINLCEKFTYSQFISNNGNSVIYREDNLFNISFTQPNEFGGFITNFESPIYNLADDTIYIRDFYGIPHKFHQIKE